MPDIGGVVVERDVIRVEGVDAEAYLQGQLSQDVSRLAVGGSAWTFVLQPQGKVDAWFRLTRVGDEAYEADVDAGAGERLLARLQRFLLRTKAELSLSTVPMAAVRGTVEVDPPDGARAVDPEWPGIDGVDLLGAARLPSGVTAWSTDEFERARIEAGVPAMGSELTEATIPAEAGVVERSVSFTKGCFTGQELVARIDSRGGNVPRHLRGLVTEGELPVGADVVVDGKVVGRVTSSVPDRALAYVGRAVEPPAEATVDGRPVEVVALPTP
jgi:tRNA-modifying protein YgfZ